MLFGYQWNTSISSSLATFLKVGIRKKSFRKICGICVIESPLKMMKNVFYFIVKALFVLKIFNFFSRHFGHIGKKTDLIRKIRLFSKFMTSQPCLQAIAIYMLPNISQSKGNETGKFGQLIEHNLRNIFLQKLCEKWGKKTSSRPLFIFVNSLKWNKRKWSVV